MNKKFFALTACCILVLSFIADRNGRSVEKHRIELEQLKGKITDLEGKIEEILAGTSA